MRDRSLRLVAISLGAFALGSCSYAYDLLAVVIDGRLAFIVDPSSDRKADCIGSIHVSVDKGGPIARAEEGDDEALVQNGGVYWWKSTEVSSCENSFPIFYGQQIEGAPFIYDEGRPISVEAKPLRIGMVYEVTTTGSGSGSGEGRFRIDRNGRVENLRDDLTPAIVNEQGYDVTDYANMTAPPDLGTYDP